MAVKRSMSFRRKMLTRKATKARAPVESWGYHLVVNAAGCKPEAIRSAAIIREFSKALVERIDMVAYGSPRIVRFGDGNKKGYSLVQLIETSNITAHFVEETNDIYLDIFSCKHFQPNDALEVFQKFFHPQRVEYTMTLRNAPSV